MTPTSNRKEILTRCFYWKYGREHSWIVPSDMIDLGYSEQYFHFNFISFHERNEVYIKTFSPLLEQTQASEIHRIKLSCPFSWKKIYFEMLYAEKLLFIQDTICEDVLARTKSTSINVAKNGAFIWRWNIFSTTPRYLQGCLIWLRYCRPVWTELRSPSRLGLACCLVVGKAGWR